jgi:hypothetical protein
MAVCWWGCWALGDLCKKWCFSGCIQHVDTNKTAPPQIQTHAGAHSKIKRRSAITFQGKACSQDLQQVAPTLSCVTHHPLPNTSRPPIIPACATRTVIRAHKVSSAGLGPLRMLPFKASSGKTHNLMPVSKQLQPVTTLPRVQNCVMLGGSQTEAANAMALSICTSPFTVCFESDT